ncbi:hypothetical protein jhhlp_003226 [Lomentospora prolificans]|uniref:Uncharacterized protein n=1 Tax=Lomentospora prolificans TaxID=41688 RepID=A0A2N3NGH4_9PEZI|nr:hypothetical protein jhhlp_003226 [Lomentospora prolificans]
MMYTKTFVVLAALVTYTTAAVCPSPKPTYQACGGMLPKANECEEGYKCVSDPREKGCGLACDQPGICVAEDIPKCGGYPGFKCPEGLECFDDPTDDCDPENGGFDCMGFCL